MATSATLPKVSYADYALFEVTAEEKHEWLGGEVFAMAGGTPEHGGIAGAILGLLMRELVGKPCRPFPSDVRVRVQATGLGTYPDVSVVCGTLETDPEDEHSIVNPKVIVEVLSPSTEAYDRGQKFAHYKQIASLAHYVLVSSDRKLIEWFTRGPINDEPGVWLHRAAGPGENVELTALACSLSVNEVYFNPLKPSPMD
jgi:Uma2 family endonuclease